MVVMSETPHLLSCILARATPYAAHCIDSRAAEQHPAQDNHHHHIPSSSLVYPPTPPPTHGMRCSQSSSWPEPCAAEPGTSVMTPSHALRHVRPASPQSPLGPVVNRLRVQGCMKLTHHGPRHDSDTYGMEEEGQRSMPICRGEGGRRHVCGYE